MAVTDLVRSFWDKTPEEMKRLCSQEGGLSSYFGTSNSDTVHAMVEQGDEKAVRVWKAMIYQVTKYIGSMAAVLRGKVDGILLTGRSAALSRSRSNHKGKLRLDRSRDLLSRRV